MFSYRRGTAQRSNKLPMLQHIRYSTEKPWINSQFRQLIKRQKAYLAGDRSAFRKFRNQVSPLACKLRAQFYARKVEQLHETNQHSWWKHVRSFLHLKSHSPFSLLDVALAYRTINHFPILLTIFSRIWSQSSQRFCLHYLMITVVVDIKEQSQ